MTNTTVHRDPPSGPGEPETFARETTRQPSTGRAQESTPYDPDRRRGYLQMIGVFAAGSALAATGIVRRGAQPDPIGPPTNRWETWSDVALVGIAAHKASRLITRHNVTTPLRSPFTRFTGSAGPGESQSEPVGSGWRRSVGELIGCPFCVDVWCAAAANFGLHLLPRSTRFVLATTAAVAVSDALQFVYAALEDAAEGDHDAEFE